MSERGHPEALIRAARSPATNLPASAARGLVASVHPLMTLCALATGAGGGSLAIEGDVAAVRVVGAS